MLRARDGVAQDDRGLLDAQRRRRFVEDQDPGPEVLGAGDGQRLAFAAGQRPDQLLRVADLDPDVLHLLAGDPRGLVAVEALERREALGRLVAEEEVAADAHQRHHRQVLVDGRDPGVERVAGRAEAHRLAVDGERPFVGRMDARTAS